MCLLLPDLPCLSGVSRYSELMAKFKAAHNRIVSGVGAEAFASAVSGKFPLVLTDNALFAVAEPLGWQVSCLMNQFHNVSGFFIMSIGKIIECTVSFWFC